MQTFFIVWIGQVISLLGSKLTEFALGFWILDRTYQDTGTITQFALTILFMYLPKVIISPLAGVLVDRWNRRSAMIMSDLGTGIVTLAVFFLVGSNNLAIWHIYLALTITSSFNAFQQPAYIAAISQLVTAKNLSRANGMVQASFAIAKIAAPAIAGLLMKFWGLKTILSIDIVTFTIAIVTLLSVKFPDFKRFTRRRRKVVHQVASDAVAAWNYIALRPGLVRLVCFIAISYFTMGMLEVVLWPLLYQPGSTEQLGFVLSVGGCGMLVGSVLMSLWSGPQNRVKAIISFVGFQGIIILIGGLKISTFILAIGIFGYLFSQPIIVSCNQAIWQSKVPSRLQGRVFALQQTLERSLAICAYLLAGPLVDNVLNPLMAEGGIIAQSISKFINTGMGQGVTLLLVLLGLLNLTVVAIAYREPRLRYLETELPDRNKFNQTKTTPA
ncbi:MFS transporter [Waterburya agarophytonicola K14]|uniref:MFS transporter n=1 Tax=Waterburya agarophytonicola KI4 TaxID=2874699 RepID=A0A964FHA8_9CYAN|nr:MFS transporter [Waterburya agarophytonicola]MCC0177313.1 MFS transporter [Waterburya agarophytonicola KI4]